MNLLRNITRSALLLVWISCVMIIPNIHAIYYPKTIRPFFETCEDVCPLSLWVFTDLLYWGAFEDGLTIKNSIEDDAITPNGAEKSFISREKGLNFNWRPGFRVGVGSGFIGHGGLGGILSWTHLFSSAQRNDDVNLKGNWKIHFDEIDAITGIELCSKPCMLLNLIGGLRGVRIIQNLRTSFTNVLDESTEIIVFEVCDHNKSKFYGFGPTLGLEAEWYLKCGISLYGEIGGSILFGHTHVSSITDSFNTTIENNVHITRSISECHTVADAAIGVRWNHCWHCGLNVALDFGFEHHQFFHMNSVAECGDLYLDGFVAGVRIGF